MALARNLTKDQLYPVKQGEFAGFHVRIVDPTPIPDTDVHRRKVQVQVIRDGVAGELVYVLPRQIDDGVPTLGERKALEESAQPVRYTPTTPPAFTMPPPPSLDRDLADRTLVLAQQHVDQAQAALKEALVALVHAEEFHRVTR